MKLSPFLFGLLVAFSPFGVARSGQGEASKSQTCEYLNFVVFRDFPGFEHPDELANQAVLEEVEELFSLELERVGFHRVRDGETPWLFLRAILQQSTLSSNSVSGIVELGPRSNLHRDLALALSDGSISAGAVGMVAVIEADTRPAGARLRFPAKIEDLARHESRSTQHKSDRVLSALCEWRAQLVGDGLTVEELQRQLIDGMDRVRRDRRQQKSLELEVEP